MAVLKDGKKGNIGSMPSFSGRLNETPRKSIGFIHQEVLEIMVGGMYK